MVAVRVHSSYEEHWEKKLIWSELLFLLYCTFGVRNGEESESKVDVVGGTKVVCGGKEKHIEDMERTSTAMVLVFIVLGPWLGLATPVIASPPGRLFSSLFVPAHSYSNCNEFVLNPKAHKDGNLRLYLACSVLSHFCTKPLGTKNPCFHFFGFSWVFFNGFLGLRKSNGMNGFAGFVSDTFSALLKWLWALPTSTKTGNRCTLAICACSVHIENTVCEAQKRRSVLQFESGYMVETVFDGSKHGIEPYSIKVSPDGELLVLDSVNSNILRITPPLSRYSRARLLAGSADGYAGHVDGRPREARLNHPKGFAVDDKGNVYVADTMNMAIRKIGEAGVTTIAGGRSGRAGHVDGPSEDAKFSNDFDIVYVSSTCSLLVVDRGNQAIREIQLHYDDCAYQYGSNFPSGILIAGGAALMGYVLGLLQQGVGAAIFSKREKQDKRADAKKLPSPAERPALIPVAGEQENQDAGWVSFGKFFVDIFKSTAEIIGGLFSYVTGGFRRKPLTKGNLWPLRDSLLIPEDEDVEPQRTPRKKKTVTFREPEADTPMSPPNSSGLHNVDVRPTREFMDLFGSTDSVNRNRRKYEDEDNQGHLQPLRHHSSAPETYFERSYDSSNEVVFGAVQETRGINEPMEIKPVDYGDPMYDHHNIRSRTIMGNYYDY
eukprot:Gb_11764 [translate_table: standard]